MKSFLFSGLALALAIPLQSQTIVPANSDGNDRPTLREMQFTRPVAGRESSMGGKNVLPNGTSPAVTQESDVAPYVREYDPAKRPDGAYMTYIDYQQGRVDTSVHADTRYVHRLADLGPHEFSLLKAELKKEGGVSVRREVWGYHVDGQGYVQVSGDLYTLTTDRVGRDLVYLPGEAAAELPVAADSHTVFEVQPETGTLRPFRMDHRPQVVADHTILQGATGYGGPDVKVITADGSVQNLGPGEYLLLDATADVSFSVDGYTWEPLCKELKVGTPDKPILYRVAALIPGDVRVTRASTKKAREVREAIQDGMVESAR